MKAYLRMIDSATSGNRYDVTPLFADADSLARVAADLGAPFREERIDYVVCVDALGFILGTAIARHLNDRTERISTSYRVHTVWKTE